MKLLAVPLIFCLPLLGSAQENQFILEGKINGYDAPAKIYLQFNQKEKTLTDSATLKGGRFSFSGKAGGEPVSAYLSVNPKGNGVIYKDYRQVFLEKGAISIDGDSLKTARVKGGQVNSDNERYAALTRPVNAEDNALAATISAETPEQRNSDRYQREISKKQHEIDQRSLAVNEQFARAYPASYISLTALEMCEAYGADYAVIGPLYEQLSPQIRQTEAGRAFATLLSKLKAVSLGSQAPMFTELDTSGNKVSLASFKGKYVLLDFWASWCGPCRRENPRVVDAYQKFNHKNFTIIGISLDRSTGRKRWMDAIHKDRLSWTQVSDLQFWKSKEAELYAVRGIPANFLIDPNGRIIARNLHGTDLEDKLTELLGNP